MAREMGFMVLVAVGAGLWGCGSTAKNVRDDVVEEAEGAGDTVERVGDDISHEAKDIAGEEDGPAPAPAPEGESASDD
jgi:hypothetical protein